MNPPRIVISGDHQAGQWLVSRGKRLLTSLLTTIGRGPLFQGEGLFQGNRTWTNLFGMGETISCRVIGPQAEIVIHVPPAGERKEKIERKPKTTCFCTCCFSDAEVIEVLGEYDHVGAYGEDEMYPTICNASDIAVWNYNGIRYKVNVCKQINDMAFESEFIAIPTDFSHYEAGDAVIVVFRGKWEGEIWNPDLILASGCHNCEGAVCDEGCKGNWPPGRQFADEWFYADGTFVVSPIQVAGVTT